MAAVTTTPPAPSKARGAPLTVSQGLNKQTFFDVGYASLLQGRVREVRRNVWDVGSSRYPQTKVTKPREEGPFQLLHWLMACVLGLPGGRQAEASPTWKEGARTLWLRVGASVLQRWLAHKGTPSPAAGRHRPPPHPGTWAQLPASNCTRVMQVLESVQTRTSDGHRLTKQASPGDDSVTGRGRQLQKQPVRTQLPAKMKGGQMEGSR